MQSNTKKYGGSIDAFFNQLKLDKLESIELLNQHKQNQKILSENELEKIAKIIYLSTFKAAINLEYNDLDEKDNWGCIDPMVQLYAEVRSYGIATKEREEGVAESQLSKPAFWFAHNHIFVSHVYERKNLSNRRNTHHFLWKPLKPNPDFSTLLLQYEKTFEGISTNGKNPGAYKPYMVANLKKALGIK